LEYILPPRAGKYQQLSLGGGYEKGEEKGGNKEKRVKKNAK
jgi:hypothetical protein